VGGKHVRLRVDRESEAKCEENLGGFAETRTLTRCGKSAPPVRTNSSQETAFGVKCAVRGTSPFLRSPTGFRCREEHHGFRSKCSKTNVGSARRVEFLARRWRGSCCRSNHPKAQHPFHHGRRHRMDAGRPLP